MKTLTLYGAALLVLLVLDGVWLKFIIKDFYVSQVGKLLAPTVTWWAVALFYLVYAGAVIYFAVVGASSLGEAALRGAALGFVAYMTYDLTNLATLAGWSLPLALVDMAWGACITAAAAAAAFILV